MIDLIVVALVAVIVVSRFTKFKLPTDPAKKTPRNGRATRADLDQMKRNPLLRDDAPNVVDITAQTEAVKADKKPVQKGRAPDKDARAKADTLSGAAKIAALDPTFDEAVFLDGAKAAYRYFYECWNARNEDGLDNLCAPALFERVVADMQDATYQPVEIVELRDVRIVATRVHGRTAVVDVEFDAREREGKLDARPVQRRWVLARALGSDDPNWELQAMNRGVDA